MEKQNGLTIVIRLLEELDKEGINYCHWKSNASLDRSLSGENDLDLLIARSDSQHFTEILDRLGFKQAEAPGFKKMPGILDYYGYDLPSDRFVHVHAHYQLVVGQDFTKNYHLPLETAYLASSIQWGMFRIPSPEFEFILFVIRMVLKHSTWDTILGRQGSLSPSEELELKDLTARADRAQTRKLLHQHLPNISGELFNDCLRSIQPGSSLWTRIQTGERLQKSLRGLSRYPRTIDLFLKFWRRGIMAVERRFLRKRQGMRLLGGGSMIAVIGGDGAGKTTVVNALQKWLNRPFLTKRIHLGKPTWSLTTTVVRAILKVGRMLGLYPFEKEPSGSENSSEEPFFPGYPWLFRSLCTARDRFLTYARARRFASNGGVVLCDRFPLGYLSRSESPRFTRLKNGKKAGLVINYLSKLEKKYYQSILTPEIVIVLRLDPGLAVQRKQEEEEGFVRMRSEEVWNFDWEQTAAHVVDASASKEEVLSKVKSIVWSNL